MKTVVLISFAFLLVSFTLKAQFYSLSSQLNQDHYLYVENGTAISGETEITLQGAQWAVNPVSLDNFDIVWLMNRLNGLTLDYQNGKLIFAELDEDSKSQQWELGPMDEDGFCSVKNLNNSLYLHDDWGGNLDLKSYFAHQGAFWLKAEVPDNLTIPIEYDNTAITPGSMDQPSIVVYTLPTCSRCIYAMEYLNEHNIRYLEYDVSDKKYGDQMYELVEKTGRYDGGSIKMPVIVNHGTVSFNIIDLQSFMPGLDGKQSATNQQDNGSIVSPTISNPDNNTSGIVFTDYNNGDITILRSQVLVAVGYLNQIRQNPSLYSSEFGVDLGNVEPRPKIIWNEKLLKVAEAKAADMISRDYFDHVDPDGNGMNIKIYEAGYELEEYCISDRSNNFYESIGMGYSDGVELVKNLIIDEGVPSLGHRRHLLSIGDESTTWYEVGIGMARKGNSGVYSSVIIVSHKK